MSAPQSLTAYGSGNTYTGPFVWNSTVIINNVSHEVYYNNTTANAGNANYSIAVNTVTNTWLDYGNDHPFNAPAQNTETNGDVTITLSSPGHPQLFKFLKPVVSGWGGSGIQLHNFTQCTGTIQHFGTNITWSIDDDCPTASASNVYSLQLDGVSHYSSGITHTNGAHTTATISAQLGVWKLWHQGTSSDTELASLTVTRLVAGKRKVFCNFW